MIVCFGSLCACKRVQRVWCPIISCLTILGNTVPKGRPCKWRTWLKAAPVLAKEPNMSSSHPRITNCVIRHVCEKCINFAPVYMQLRGAKLNSVNVRTHHSSHDQRFHSWMLKVQTSQKMSQHWMKIFERVQHVNSSIRGERPCRIVKRESRNQNGQDSAVSLGSKMSDKLSKFPRHAMTQLRRGIQVLKTKARHTCWSFARAWLWLRIITWMRLSAGRGFFSAKFFMAFLDTDTMSCSSWDSMAAPEIESLVFAT